tara:strand:- start:124 stop:288 length:165 start_codon:yes stop_codon:yes gene_type:complete
VRKSSLFPSRILSNFYEKYPKILSIPSIVHLFQKNKEKVKIKKNIRLPRVACDD